MQYDFMSYSIKLLYYFNQNGIIVAELGTLSYTTSSSIVYTDCRTYRIKRALFSIVAFFLLVFQATHSFLVMLGLINQ